MDYVAWHHHAPEAQQSRIMPDGCRDLIVRDGRVLMTNLDATPRMVRIAAGSRMTGYRLRPGAWVEPGDVTGALSDISALIRYDAEVGEAITALATGPVAHVARQAGMSQRGLQRCFAAAVLPPPGFWRMLGRARRAVATMASDAPLAELAIDAGYADQAHMTRDFRRWFGLTPHRLRMDPGARADLSQPGLGNWTGEQISIR